MATWGEAMASKGWTRRTLLIRMGGSAFLLLQSGSHARASMAATSGGRELSEADHRLALLGGRFAELDSWDARCLAHEVAAALPACTQLLGLARRARLAKERLLEPERLAREFGRGEVRVIDGWLVSRSEAALSAYLHLLAMGGLRTT